MSDLMNAYVQSDTYVNRDAWQNAGNAQKTDKADKTDKTDKMTDKVDVSGRTYGNARLSKKAAEYYEKLKQKFGNAEFVLVDADKIDEAKKNIGSFAGSSSMVVLIDTDKIEKMTVDEEYRKKYESIISNASNQISQVISNLQSQYGSSAGKIKQVGMTIDDGGNASFFAVIDKSLKLQKERIEKKQAEKAEEKAEEKALKAEKEKKEAAEEKRKEAVEETEVITAGSLEALYNKLSNILYDDAADSVQTESEKYIGQSVDYTA